MDRTTGTVFVGLWFGSSRRVHIHRAGRRARAGPVESCSHVPYWYNVDLPCHVFALLRSASVGPGTCVASSSPQIIYDFLELYFHRFLDSHN